MMALSGAQRCAVLFLLLEEEAAARLMRRLDPSEVHALGAAMVELVDIDRATIEAVLDDFLHIAGAATGLGGGARQQVQRLLTRALGDERAGTVLRKLNQDHGPRGMEILKWMDAQSIAEALADEHPQVAAIVLSHLDAEHAADVLGLLPEPMRPDLVMRLATLDAIPPDAIAELEAVMQARFSASVTAHGMKLGGVDLAARILNAAPGNAGAGIVETMALVDAELTQQIREHMFAFDNLVALDDRSLQAVLRNVESDVLVKALKGADPLMRQRLLGCMSSRAAMQITDELEAMGPMRVSEVRDAQKAVVAVARQLADRGEIMIGAGGRDFV